MAINLPTRHYIQNALFLAHAANACYEGHPAQYKGFKQFGFDEIVTFAPDDTSQDESARGYIGANRDAIVLAFRGTDDVADWLTNLNVVQIEDHGALVHRGFSQALTAVWPRIETTLQSLLDRHSRKILVTGHSLGGALATLAALCIQRMGIEQLETLTFGQPRVGNRDLAGQITAPFYRFAYYADPVCLAPFSVPRAMQYKHAGMLKLIDATGYIIDRESHFLTRLLSKVLSAKQVVDDFFDNNLKSFLSHRINDHFMVNYIENIERNISGSLPPNFPQNS